MSDPEIDVLYQVPLADFTTARNALVKARGAAGADVKKLEKPSLPAWGVNQLYWRERTLWNRLGDASLAVRQAHVAIISGRTADVAAAEATHGAALKDATATVRRLIESAGDKATAATMDAVAETLQALPSQDPPGRLVKPLKPLGFAALMGLGIPIGEVPRSAGFRGPEVQGSKGSKGPGVQGSKGPGVQGSKRSEAREAKARAAARKAAAQALRTAKAAETKAEAAAAEAQKALATAERELDKTRDRLVFLDKQRTDAETHARAKARSLQEATNARIQAAQDLDELAE